MDGQNPSKVDMSLDDIIKLSKKEKKKTIQQNRGRGRGSARGRGGNFSGRGRGRGQGRGAHNLSVNRENMQGVNRNATRGRGAISRGRGNRGRGAQRQSNVTVSPLNRKTTSLKTVRGRGRGRGQRNSLSQMFTNSNQVQPNTPQAQRRQRLNVVKAQAALLHKKQMALKNLQTAKKTMQDINKALQKTSRTNVVDLRRGLVPTNGSPQPGGPGNRKLLTGLMRQNFKGSNMSLASTTSGRQMVNTSVTITNQAAAKRRRQWRPKNSDVTVHVSNTQKRGNKSSPAKPSNIIDQLKLLKPAVSTTYKFQKNVFATSSTTVSLNDRFSSPSSSSLSDNGLVEEERKVFI